ncbi:MAG TPA: hypothetical protein VK133_01220 [Amoebophilaceae bacterium]|jgi:pimeloyl-ACP methyl ester carboxylesterase|nr:hypothetical protein [Amoebophilaceae bacterium]
MKQSLRLVKHFLCLVLLFPIPSQAQGHKHVHNKPLFVLFHGLCNNTASFTRLQSRLQKAFPAATVVALSCVEGPESLALSIEEQAQKCFQELVQKVENAATRPIILIGYSQGGMRAYAFLQQCRTQLNVKGLVGLATPWEGVPGARVDEKMLSEHLTDAVETDLQILSTSLGHPADELKERLVLEIRTNQMICQYPGAQDLIIGSPFLSNVQQMLPKEPVAILAIAGGQSDFGALLAPKRVRHSFKALNQLYAFFTTGHKRRVNTSHDMWIPCDSQLAKTIVIKRKRNFQRLLIEDAFHSAQVWSMIPVHEHKNILTHPRVFKAIAQFAKKQLSSSVKPSRPK